jgi:predicted nucleotidyltransferase
VTGEHLAPDVRELLRLLHVHGVRYLLVGGEAVIHHGYPRLTGDIDLFYDASPVNARRLYAALEEFWNGPVPAVSAAEDLLEPDVVVQFGRPPNRVDLLSSLGSVAFATAWRRRVKETLRIRRRAIPLPVIGLEDLLRSKRDAGRHKDLDDVERLQEIARRRPKKRR